MITLTLAISVLFSTSPTWSPLFNGDNLDGWVIVNGDVSTWTVTDNTIICSGKPTGVMRTEIMYENFILELDWRHMVEFGNAGLFVWSDPIPSIGVPFTRSVEVQVMVGEVAEKNKKWYTTQGDIFPIWGATMTPDDVHPMGEQYSRDFPSEHRTNPAPEWNHYVVTCIDGQINLAVNGAFVTGGSNVTPCKGYICLESEGTEAHFKNINILELPPTGPATNDVATASIGFVTLFNGINLNGWNTSDNSHWTVSDNVLHCDDNSDTLLRDNHHEAYELLFDYQCKDEHSSVYVVIGNKKTELPSEEVGKWVRCTLQGEGDTIGIGGINAKFTNLFIRPLK